MRHISKWYQIRQQKAQKMEIKHGLASQVGDVRLENRAPEDPGETGPAGHSYLVFKTFSNNPLGTPS